MLNDNWIDGDNGLLDSPKIEPEGFAMEFDVLGENPYRVVGHCARIQEGLGSGDRGYALRQGSRLAVQNRMDNCRKSRVI